MLSTKNTLVESILRECEDDYVGLWSIVREVHSILKPTTNLMEETLTVLRPLLEQNKIIAGNFAGTKFVCDGDSSDVILEKIATQWLKLNRNPDIGEIIWFTTP